METLKPGTALFTGPSGAVLRDATGELFAVALPDETVEAVRAALTGDAPAPPELAAFARAGHLGRRAAWPGDRRVVAVLDTAGGPDDELVRALDLAGAKVVVVPPDPAAVLALAPAALCAWHDGPAPEHWLELDVLAGHGIAWQRVSREGRHVLLEPLGVSHRDVRLRRLAAAGSGHGHLRAYWAGTRVVTGDEAPDAVERRLVAALAVKDLTRRLAGATGAGGPLTPAGVPADRRLRVLDLDTGAIADHPVLPVPDSAP
ncbi:hypothetical protein [Saccharothrix lopnurensis]|uniref:Uncharacterized protein n=1 Tax=Saccharothrix lopnurensis TaxID=1670621 RepID=A0ABW1P7B5_9PSEU